MVEDLQYIFGLLGMKVSLRNLEKFQFVTDCKTAHKREIILKANTPVTKVHIIVSGIARSYYIDKNGNEVVKKFSCREDFTTSGLILQKEPSSYNLEALTDCRYLEIDIDRLNDLIQTDIFFKEFYIRLLEFNMSNEIARREDLLEKDATERYLDFRRKFAKYERDIQVAHIASYLGITPVSLSRIRNNLRKNDRLHMQFRRAI